MQNTPVSLLLVSPSLLFLSAVAHSPSFIPPRLPLFSLLPPVSLFLPTLPTVSPSPSLCSSVILPRLFYLPQSFFLPICFLFSAVSSTALLCFSSSDPTLEHLREIRRKLASEKPAVKGSSTPFALQISAQHSETFRPSSSLPAKQVVSRSTCLVWLFDASTPGELP